MKKVYVLGILMLNAMNLWAQNPTFEWAGNMGGTNNDYCYSLASNSNEQIVTAGRFEMVAEFQMGSGGSILLPSAGSSDIFVAKHDIDGNNIWAVSWGSTGSDYAVSVTTNNAGDIFVVGRFTNTILFGPGPGQASLTATGGDATFIMKLDQAGQVQWAKKIGGSLPVLPAEVQLDNAGNVIVSGYFQGTADFDPGAPVVNLSTNGQTDAYVLKLDGSGNYVWAKTFGGVGYDYCSSLAIDNSDNVFLGGRYSGTVDFDPGAAIDNHTVTGTQDMFLSKLNSAGDYQFAKTFDGGGINYVQGVEVDASGNLFLTGYFSSTDFDPGAGTVSRTTTGGQDIFVLKLTSAGNYDWVHTFGGTGNDQGTVIKINSMNDVNIAGTFESIVDFDPTANSLNFNSNGQTDNFLLRLSNTGGFKGAQFFGSSNADVARGLTTQTVSGVEKIWITGNFSGNGDFDPTNGSNTINSYGSTDAFVVKLENCFASSITADAISLANLTDECEVFSPTPPTATTDCGFQIYGNPNVSFPISTQGTTVVTWTFDDGSGNVTTQTQNVIIADVTAPVADVSTLSDLTGICYVDAPTSPTATDNCSFTPVTGTPDVSFPITTLGTTMVTWTYTDANGNTSTQTQNVIITAMDTSVVVSGITLTANLTTATTYQWVDCNANYSAISGATSSSFTPSANGSYAVILTDGVSCVDTSSCYTVATVSINENDMNRIEIFPNPSNGYFTINLGFSVEQAQINILDLTGKLVFVERITNSNKTILTNEIQEGVYIIQIKVGDKTYIKRMSVIK